MCQLPVLLYRLQYIGIKHIQANIYINKYYIHIHVPTRAHVHANTYAHTHASAITNHL